MNLIYCYGVIEENQSFEIKGFESKIYTIPFKDIFAVVSDVSENNFSQEIIDKNIKNMKWLTENGQIHEDVVESVMKKTTIIPMKFCTIFKKKDKIVEMLEEKYADFKYDLTHLKNKIELAVKVYFDSEPLRQEILEESPDLKKIEQEAEKKTSGIAYFDKQKIDILLKEKLQQKLSNKAKEIFDKIKVLAEESKQNELLSKKLTKKDMLLNAVFLIKKLELEKFKDYVKKKEKDYDFKFEIYGPFPPYNFIK